MSDDDEIEQFTGEIADMFSQTFSSFGATLFGPFSGSLRPLSRLQVDHDTVTVIFDLPGVSKEGISVVCTQDYISVEAEGRRQQRATGREGAGSSVEFVKYSERIALPVLVDPDQGSAKFRNGMVVVKVPRLRGGRQLEITEARGDG